MTLQEIETKLAAKTNLTATEIADTAEIIQEAMLTEFPSKDQQILIKSFNALI